VTILKPGRGRNDKRKTAGKIKELACCAGFYRSAWEVFMRGRDVAPLLPGAHKPSLAPSRQASPECSPMFPAHPSQRGAATSRQLHQTTSNTTPHHLTMSAPASPERPPASPERRAESPVILYRSPTALTLLRTAAINLVLPFINGLMLGFGELFAHELAFRWGWGTTRVCILGEEWGWVLTCTGVPGP
jgi:hypothetical protein